MTASDFPLLFGKFPFYAYLSLRVRQQFLWEFYNIEAVWCEITTYFNLSNTRPRFEIPKNDTLQTSTKMD